MSDASRWAEYYDLGGLHRAVSTRSGEAQVWFDRGLVWSYAFNHEEAVKCFERAAAHDDACAMAYWGVAYALGPNYNKPWDLFGRRERQSVVERTHRAVEMARDHCAAASPVERALVEALCCRYPRVQVPSRKDCEVWNREYADAMAAVYARFADDLDVATLYADSMMNLTPWQLWDLKSGQPAKDARTPEIKRVLERALSLDGGSRHPGVLHLYIHLMEMSPSPELAMPAADNLRGLVPDAGHLNHMPSHLDVLVGDYARAVAANFSAIRADDKFYRREGPMNFYTLYRCHDFHFCLYSAMFAGQSRVALDTVARLEATISDELLRVRSPPMADWLESFLAMRLHALIRFGRWDDVLALSVPEDQDLYCVTTALTYYARTVALAALNRVDQARHQRALFLASVPRVKPTRTLFNNKCIDILCVAESLLEGEVAYRAGDHDAAFAHLRAAVVKYDGLPFDEPWGWMQPARHALGALLLERGRAADALDVYAADLGFDKSVPRAYRHPNNVWALHGYHECLVRLGRTREADEVEPKLRKALQAADVEIRSSCFCRTTVAKI